jgi:outer membrane protein, multidrug efflux system
MRGQWGFCALRIAVAGFRPALSLLWSIGLVQLLSGCMLASEKPDLAIDIPAAYQAAGRAPYAATPALDWWREFHSRELTSLIQEAEAANFDIGAAIGRILQADAQARISGAPLLPNVDLNGDASRTRSSQRTSSSSSSSKSSSTGSEHVTYSASLSASYEIDFWGKNLATLRAAQQNAIASRYAGDVVRLTTEAAVANAYFQVLSAQDRLTVARRNVGSASRILGLIRQRLQAGTASDLDIAQQESVVATERATIPLLEQTLRQNSNALALLLGRPPESFHLRGGGISQIRIPRVTPGLPSDLLLQRPDIQEAEANLAAADANVYAARAAFFPSITLTGEGGYQSAVLKYLFRPEAAFYTAAASLAQPIFDAGKLLGNLELERGKQEELLQDYRKAVVSGFTDVDNALVAVQQTAQRQRLEGDVVSASSRAFSLSETRLREGTIDLVTLLNTQQSLFQAEDSLAQARLAHLQAIVGLFQALGGGWEKPAVVTAKVP